MRDSILGLTEKADFAIAACAGVVGREDLVPVAESVRNVRIRLSYPEDLLVVALVGGTGSGKSSLFNAIAGSELAAIGGVRPTTGEPYAVTSPQRRDVISGYLDELGVEERAVAEVPRWLCLVDMPDTDSVIVDHRLTVEAVLPRLDVLVWVADPEKYRDAALHLHFIRPLSEYAGQFLFVLNQTDRLEPGAVERVLEDFNTALHEDGLHEATCIATAANPPSGPPRGVESVLKALNNIAEDRSGVYKKLLVDLEATTSELLTATGGGPLGFEERARQTVDEAARLLEQGDAPGAVGVMVHLVDSIADETTGPVSERVRAHGATVPARLQEATNSLDGRRGVLEELVLGPVREILADRARANAAIVDLALSVTSVSRGRR